MLIEKIKEDLIIARKNNSPSKSILNVFFAEASRIGKDKRNGLSTDDEVIVVGKKIVANASETAKILADRGLDNSVYLTEIEAVSSYLPKQLSTEELTSAISEIAKDLSISGPKAMGAIMAKLKATYGNTYDGKVASEIVKTFLT